MGVMSVLRGLEKRALTESTPIYDRLMSEVGNLFDENPWDESLLVFDFGELPADYVLPPEPLRLAYRRLVSRFDTTAMPVIVSRKAEVR